jgi:hypothetical protein
MSKRCKLQKEYYKEFGNYKGYGKYTDHYVNWLERKVLAINYTHCCTELKELDNDNFEDWIIVNGYAVHNDYYLKNDIAFSESDLIKIYNKEVMSL